MKTALVTGANRGLGKGLVEEFAHEGYTVYAGMRNVADSPFNSKLIKPVYLDVQDDASIEAAAKLIASDGPLDLLINNAGVHDDITPSGSKERLTVLKSVDRQALLALFDVNAVGPLMVVKYLSPLMTNEDSFIINISSERASFSNENTHANYGYRSSKVALNMFTKCLLHDLPKNISIFAVHPGWVRTDMSPGGLLSPTESAQKILAILGKWEPSMNGTFLGNDGNPFPL